MPNIELLTANKEWTIGSGGTVRTVTSDSFVGTLTGNASGTAATVTVAAQPAITSVGTELQIGNLNVNNNTLSSTAGTDLFITPLAGQQIVLDGAIVIDAGVVTGATSITSTAFVGDVTGNASGTAATVTEAAQTTITSVGTLSGLTVNGLLTISDGTNNFNIASHDGTNGLLLGGTLVTSTATELNRLTGITSALATQSYVDGVAQGLDVKESVRVATTANITLSNLQTIDSVTTLVAGNRVLVKNQTTGSENGIYLAVDGGSWTRATDFDSDSEVTGGAFTFVEEGTNYADTGWVLSTNNPITLESTGLTFAQFSNAGVINVQTGLTKSGNEISIDSTVVTLDGLQTLSLKTLTAPTITGDGAIAGVFTGDISGNVTGNTSGTAATVTEAAQTAITSVGTLTALQVDNLNINGNTLSSTAGTDLLITPLAGQQIVLDGAIVIDAGVVTGATSITSTTFVGALTGDVTGNVSGTASKAAPIQSSFTFVPYTNLTNVLSQGTGEVFIAAGSAYNVTVAPTTATSKFFIQYKINYRCSWESDQRISFKITKTVSGDSEDTLLIRDNNLGLANAGGPFHGVWCSNYLDTVSATTNVTYKLYYKLESANSEYDYTSGILGNDGTDDAVYNSIAIQEYIE